MCGFLVFRFPKLTQTECAKHEPFSQIADFGAVKLLEPIFARHHSAETKEIKKENSSQHGNLELTCLKCCYLYLL